MEKELWVLAAGRKHNSFYCWFIGIFIFTSVLILWTRINQTLLGSIKPRSSKWCAPLSMSKRIDLSILIDWQAFHLSAFSLSSKHRNGLLSHMEDTKNYFLKNNFSHFRPHSLWQAEVFVSNRWDFWWLPRLPLYWSPEILADTFKLIWIFSPFKNVDDS